jgi:hypothetical protein
MQGADVCRFALGLGLVVLSSVTKMPFADSMLRIAFEPTRFSYQRQVFTNPYA